jgi:hypothetical protein
MNGEQREAHLYFTLQISNAVRVKSILIEKKKKETLEVSLTFFHVMKPIPSPPLIEIELTESFVSFSLKRKENNVSNIFYVKNPPIP